MPIKRLSYSNKKLLLVTLLFSLSACGGSKIVVTTDNSVEYRNAITLPPLKKPSNTQTSNQKINEEPSEKTTNNVVTNERVESPVVIDIEPSNELDEIENNVESVELERDTTNSEQTAYVESKKSGTATVRARVIEPNADSVRLLIEGSFISAWDFLSDNLKRSNITVYNKNQSAQRFAIGCGDMEEEPLVTKRGGWSFFNKKPQKTEHCSLQLASSKSNTTVAVLSRSGEEIAASAAKKLFSRLLNN